ncbi:hypothetical protein KOW79_022275 [Hemibagrus wyckioides]|uniref:Ig-like domain-containing protein n=1 Tax=Hemibagrus wyckioides TaxID=337641 RepID=A0A9D3N5W3_9TELE|nr:uncharacterized protein LOC131347966 [Hemibagrus wyckioides]KAG7314972.1 hypothetical protein KOW79_022275 [Hemibagrus wyckioides]
MRDRQMSCLLIFCLIFIKAGQAGGVRILSDPVRARLGQSASLSCKVKDEVQVVLSEWTRCTDSSSIAVFNPDQAAEHRSHVKEPYTGNVSITEYHTLTIHQVQDADFGEYCCKVTTFPSGSLNGRVHLLKEDGKQVDEGKQMDHPKSPPAGVPVMMIVFITCGVAGFVILTGIISLLLCSKRRRKVRNPVHVVVTASLSPKQPSLLQKDSHTPSHTTSHTPSHSPVRDDEDDDDEDDDDVMYLNVRGSQP